MAIEGGAALSANNILIATGSRPLEVKGFEFDEKQVLSSTGILDLKILPKSLVILGGGAIGCEFAFVMNAFGVAVTVVEMTEHLLPTEDFECAAVLAASFDKAGITVHTGTRATGLTRSAKASALPSTHPRASTVEAEKALVVFGRRPNTEDLGLDSVGLKADTRGFIPVGDYNQTAAKGIFAIGDVTSTPLLAHVASREGELAVEFIAGHGGQMKQVNPAEVPSAIYCEPQVAGFGLREDDAKTGVSLSASRCSLPRHRQGRGGRQTRGPGETDRRPRYRRDPGWACGGIERHRDTARDPAGENGGATAGGYHPHDPRSPHPGGRRHGSGTGPDRRADSCSIPRRVPDTARTRCRPTLVGPGPLYLARGICYSRPLHDRAAGRFDHSLRHKKLRHGEKARNWLDTHGVDYRFHDFRADGLDREMVARWLAELGWETLVNKRSTSWKALDEATARA